MLRSFVNPGVVFKTIRTFVTRTISKATSQGKFTLFSNVFKLICEVSFTQVQCKLDSVYDDIKLQFDSPPISEVFITCVPE